MRVRVIPSQAFRNTELVASGREYPQNGVVLEVPLTDLTPEERTLLLTLTPTYAGASRDELGFHLPSRSYSPGNVWGAPLVPQTPDDWRVLLADWREAHAKAQAELDAQLDAEIEENIAYLAEREAVVDDEAFYNGTALFRRQVGPAHEGRPRAAEARALYDRVSARYARVQRAREEAQRETIRRSGEAREREKEEREQAKRSWIEAHGSDYLKRCMAGGYSCQRQYALERAALEYPGWVLDFNDTARWEDRSQPSPRALELAERYPGATVVWLTAEASDDVPSTSDEELAGYDDEPEPHEALAIRGFLGKYDLVRDLRG